MRRREKVGGLRRGRGEGGRAVAAAAAVVAWVTGASLLSGGSGGVAEGATRTWNGGSSGGSWANSANWSPAGVPGSGDTANVFVSPASSYSVTFDGDYTAAGALNALYLHSTNSAPLTFRQDVDGADLYTTYEYVADTGNATYRQSAATNNASLLVLGYSSTSTGTYVLSGAGSVSATDFYVGYGGTGAFSQTAGSSAATYLYVGFGSVSSGTYALSGSGVLSGFRETIGRSNVGAFTQSGGTNTVGDTLNLGTDGGSGSYTLSGGQLTVYGACAVGQTDSAGALTLTGGAATVHDTVKVYDRPGNSLSLAGGALAVDALDFSGHPERFAWTGGELRFSGGYSLDADLFSGASVTLKPGMTLAADGGAANFGSLTLAGGTLAGAGTLVNTTLLTAGYGTIAQPLTNGAGATLRFGPGRSTTLSSSLLNAGYLLLDSSPMVSGSGSITNNFAGVITGRGTISVTSFTNDGTMTLGDGSVRISTSGNYDNTGVIRLDSPAASLVGSGINNTGTIEGRGTVAAPVLNAAGGVVEPVGGTLTLAGLVRNPAGATLRVSGDNKLLITGTFPTSAGSILLTGGTLDTMGGGLSNSGTITVAAGTSTVAVPLTNVAGSAVIVSGGATAVFPAGVSNVAGSEFRVSAGSAAVFLAPVTGAGVFTGTGSKFFEAGASAPASLATGGETTVRAAASLATGYLDEAVLTAYGPVALTPDAPDSRIGSLDLTTTGSLDLSNDALTLTATPATDVRGDLLSHQLFSSASDPTHAVGYVPAAAGPSLLIRLTLAGDANLDGALDGDDYALLDRGLAAGGAFWWEGDFTYDGVVDQQDYLLIDTTYGQVLGLSPGFLAMRESRFGEAYVSRLLASVPEPSVTGLLIAAMVPLVRGRRRRFIRPS